MIAITPNEVTPALRNLFSRDEPQARRCFSVLEGLDRLGRILVDDARKPGWAVALEGGDHSVFFGGSINREIVEQVFQALLPASDILVGMWLDDPRLNLLPPGPVYDGRTLEFYDRPLGEGLDGFISQVPPDCRLVRLDRELILRTEWGPADVEMMGGLDAWEEKCFGYGLMRGETILCEATVGQPSLGLFEPGVFTRPEERGKGYGTLVTACLVQAIEAKGGRTYWNCASQNPASAAIARKLGYRTRKEYRCMVWKQTR